MFIRASFSKAVLMNHIADACHVPSQPIFTEKQGQYLAFIHAYTVINKRPPAEADMRRHFEVTPPSVHQMVLTLERQGLITRQPGKARSIQILIAPQSLPVLN
jgi:DNA-binding MarR family transcriptional regulator